MSSTEDSFGARLRYLRRAAGLRVEDVARLADIDRSHLYAIERGTWRPSFEVLEKLARIYRVDMTDCFVFPEKHIRYSARELLRLTPNAKLARIIEAAERILGKSLAQIISEEAPPEDTTDMDDTEHHAPTARKAR